MADEGTNRRRLRRVEAAGHVRFLTFSCHRRLPLLQNGAIRRLFLDRLMTVTLEQDVSLLARVIMPEHVHLLVFPEARPDIGRFCQRHCSQVGWVGERVPQVAVRRDLCCVVSRRAQVCRVRPTCGTRQSWGR